MEKIPYMMLVNGIVIKHLPRGDARGWNPEYCYRNGTVIKHSPRRYNPEYCSWVEAVI